MGEEDIHEGGETEERHMPNAAIMKDNHTPKAILTTSINMCSHAAPYEWMDACTTKNHLAYEANFIPPLLRAP